MVIRWERAAARALRVSTATISCAAPGEAVEIKARAAATVTTPSFMAEV